MGYPWFRLYSEMLHDPKMLRLSPAVRWGWVGLLCLASEAEERGVLHIAPGVPYELDDLARVLNVSREDVAALLAEGQRMNMLTVDEEGTIRIAHFMDRQYDEPSDRPERTRERQRRHRDVADVTPSHADVTPMSRQVTTQIRSDPDPDSEGEREEEEETPSPPFPAVLLWEEVMERELPEGRWDIAIEQTVGLSEGALSLWRATLQKWRKHRYNRANVTGQLDRYEKDRSRYNGLDPPRRLGAGPYDHLIHR